MTQGTITIGDGQYRAYYKQDATTGLYEVWRDKFPYFWWKDVPSLKGLVTSFPNVFSRISSGQLDRKYEHGLKFRKPVSENPQENRRNRKTGRN